MTTDNKSEKRGFLLKTISETPQILAQNGNDQSEKNNLLTTENGDVIPTQNDTTDGFNDATRTEPNNDPSANNFPTVNDGLLPTTPANGTLGLLDTFVGGHSGEDAVKAFNLYRNKKILTQSMMDIALFSANASQLRHVLLTNDGLAITYVCMGLLVTSILLQIMTGLTLLVSTQYNVTICEERKMAFKLGNYVIIGIFLVTVVNVFISAFGGPP